MQKEHLRILVIDTDPHASLTSYLGFDDDKLEYSLFDLYAQENLTRDNVLRCVSHTEHVGLDIIAASMTLATIDRQLSGRQGVGRILSKALALIDDCYDVVLIDCPPVLGALMVNALVSASLILVPTQTEFLALKGLEGMVRTFDIMTSADPKSNFSYVIVPTMYDKRTKASQSSLAYLQKNYQDKVWDNCIPIDTRFRESSSKRMPLPIMDAHTRGSIAYHDLAIDMVNMELSCHPDLVTPSLAAITSYDANDNFAHQRRKQMNNATVAKMVSSDLA